MRRILLMLLLLSGTSAQVWAACTASLSNNSPSFGTSVTSFTLNSAEQPVSTNIYLDCDSALSLLTNDYATLTMTGASTLVASRGAMKRTDDLTVTDSIPVKLCGVSGCSSGEVRSIACPAHDRGPGRRPRVGDAGGVHREAWVFG